MKVRFKKLTETAKEPYRGSEQAAGYDLYTDGVEWLKKNQVKYHTNISVEIPEGYFGLIVPRSSTSKTGLRMANSVGIIDSDYRGEISFVYDIIEEPSPIYNYHERIGQFIILPYLPVEFEEVDELSTTTRGEGGYGSTGLK